MVEKRNRSLMKSITKILHSIRQGDQDAGVELIHLVYEELRMLARQKMLGEPRNHTLQATALVHEAWLRMNSSQEQSWDSRAHFFSAAAEAMRRILIESARKKLSLKRGGDVKLESLDDSEIPEMENTEEMFAVHEALDNLALEDKTAADLVKLRYFVGMNMAEAAASLGLKKRSTEALWTYAKAWLHREISRKMN